MRYQLGGVLDRAVASDSIEAPKGPKITLRAHKIPGKIWLNVYRLHLAELQWFADPSEFTGIVWLRHWLLR